MASVRPPCALRSAAPGSSRSVRCASLPRCPVSATRSTAVANVARAASNPSLPSPVGSPFGGLATSSIHRLSTSRKQRLIANRAEPKKETADSPEEPESEEVDESVFVPNRGSELREAAKSTLEQLEDEAGNDKQKIMELLEELTKSRELEKEAEGVRMGLEAEAQQLGSLALNAKKEFDTACEALAEVETKLEEDINLRDALSVEITDLKAKLETAKQEAIARIVELSEESPGEKDSESSGASPMQEVDALERELGEKLQAFSDVFKATNTGEEEAKRLEEDTAALAIAMTSAESLAASAMEAAAEGVTREVERDTATRDIENQLQALVKRLREDAEAKAKEQAKERKAKAKEAAKAAKVDSEAAPAVASVDGTEAIRMDVEDAQPQEDEEDPLKSAQEMEDLVFRSISEEDLIGDDLIPKKSGSENTNVPKSSKFFAASFFSSGSGPGEPEQLLPSAEEMMKKLEDNKWYIVGGAAGLALLAALVNHVFIENLLAGLAAKLKAPMTALADKTPELISSLVPDDLHIERGVVDMLVLLVTSVVAVPAICKLPGGSPVLGFLAGGALIGPHALGLVKEVHAVQHLAEFGVVFLLFNIGLELSLDRLQSMRKYVFGLGSAQFLMSTAAIAGAAMLLGLGGSSAVIVGGAMALSSTAVALQVLQDRGESGSRHGRATFSVLLLQDLAVVALLMLIPLLAPKPGGGHVSMAQIGTALGIAAVKAVVCIAVIISAGRALLRPLFRKIAAFSNAEIFAATTLLTCIGTSLLTQVAGLSMALGAFLAGLLLAETEFALQVESDIAPYRGLLLGLFFMTVGMEISFGLFVAKWQTILAGISMLIAGKVLVMTAVGPIFGLSRVASARAGFLLAPGGEFAFVAFGEAVGAGILSTTLSNQLFLVVALSMALTPYLAAIGQWIGSRYESKQDTKAMVPAEGEVDDLRGHVILAGFGRVGQVLAQIFSERLIPFVALDVDTARVQSGRALDLPVFFGDAGSAAVLHSVGAHHAACAVVALDSAAANYRAVWALNKNYPNIRTYVRAHDISDGSNLEAAGATAVVPEILEPSLQLAAAVLGELKMPPDEVSASIDAFRRSHMSDLRLISEQSGTSLGYGYDTIDGDIDEKEAQDVSSSGLPATA